MTIGEFLGVLVLLQAVAIVLLVALMRRGTWR